MKAYTFSESELADEVNKGIDLYFSELVKKRVITQAVYKSLVPYRIIVANKTFLGRLWSYIKEPIEDVSYFRVVKVLNENENDAQT